MMKPSLFIALLAGLATGCSTEQAYRSLQSMEQSRCAEWPANLYQECLQHAGMSYREYQAARERDEED